MPAPADVTLPSDTEIRVSRDFDAPRSLVFRAFTRPDLVRRWLTGPPGWEMPLCEIDLVVGGRYRYRWRNAANGREFGLNGTFEGIEPDTELRTRESFEGVAPAGEARIATGFHDRGIHCRVVYLITAESKAARDEALATGMTAGMEMSFTLLDGVLADANQR